MAHVALDVLATIRNRAQPSQVRSAGRQREADAARRGPHRLDGGERPASRSHARAVRAQLAVLAMHHDARRWHRLDALFILARLQAAEPTKAMSSPSAGHPAQIPVWDVPLRVFHWLLVAAIAVSWWTAENGLLQYHRYSGYTLLGLLVFRIYWGFAGSTTARFSHFLRSPAAALQYIATAARSPAHPRPPGHNPAGGWSVLSMLGLLAAQIGLGLVAVDVDGLESGPLSHLVSFETGRTCAELHETVFDLLLAMIALHLLAVLFYLFYRRENLIMPMITGVSSRGSEAQVSLYFGSAVRILIGVVLAAVTVWMVARGFQL